MNKSTRKLFKTLLVTFCCLVIMTITKAQTFIALPANTISMTVTCDSVDTENDVHISNPTSNNLLLSYKVISNTMPAGTVWVYSFCDWHTCKLNLPTGVTDILDTIKPNTQNASFAFHIRSDKNSGYGTLAINVYETGVPTNSLTITWNASACGASGIAEKTNQADFKVYPNPAQDVMNVDITSGYNKTGFIQVYNLVGNQLMEINNIKNKTQKIDLSGLPEGVYFVKYNNGSGTLVKKIFKLRQ